MCSKEHHLPSMFETNAKPPRRKPPLASSAPFGTTFLMCVSGRSAILPRWRARTINDPLLKSFVDTYTLARFYHTDQFFLSSFPCDWHCAPSCLYDDHASSAPPSMNPACLPCHHADGQARTCRHSLSPRHAPAGVCVWGGG